MKLKKRERDLLKTFVDIAQKLLNAPAANHKIGNGTRKRRSARDAAKLKKQIQTARKRNVPVKEIAAELGITRSYVYQLQR